MLQVLFLLTLDLKPKLRRAATRPELISINSDETNICSSIEESPSLSPSSSSVAVSQGASIWGLIGGINCIGVVSYYCCVRLKPERQDGLEIGYDVTGWVWCSGGIEDEGGHDGNDGDANWENFGHSFEMWCDDEGCPRLGGGADGPDGGENMKCSVDGTYVYCVWIDTGRGIGIHKLPTKVGFAVVSRIRARH